MTSTDYIIWESKNSKLHEWPEGTKIHVGLEHERMIFKDGVPCHVHGQPQELLPHDTLSCLAETRGGHSHDLEETIQLFLAEQARVDTLFAQQGYEIRQGEHLITRELAEASFEYNTGRKTEKEKAHRFNLVRGGGFHIHFSLTNPLGQHSDLFMCPSFIYEASHELDKSLAPHIHGASSYRVPWQFERKPWGFEYRSPIWEGDEKVLRELVVNAYHAVKCTTFKATQLIISAKTWTRIDPHALTGVAAA